VITERAKWNQSMLTVFSKSDVLRMKVPFNTSEVIIALYVGVALGSQWVMSPTNFLAYRVILCFERQCPKKILLIA